LYGGQDHISLKNCPHVAPWGQLGRTLPHRCHFPPPRPPLPPSLEDAAGLSLGGRRRRRAFFSSRSQGRRGPSPSCAAGTLAGAERWPWTTWSSDGAGRQGGPGTAQWLGVHEGREGGWAVRSTGPRLWSTALCSRHRAAVGRLPLSVVLRRHPWWAGTLLVGGRLVRLVYISAVWLMPACSLGSLVGRWWFPVRQWRCGRAEGVWASGVQAGGAVVAIAVVRLRGGVKVWCAWVKA
jgi:hypothetical protein